MLGDIGRLARRSPKPPASTTQAWVGRSLQLAARIPPSLRVPGRRPTGGGVLGYEKEAANPARPTLPRVPEPPPRDPVGDHCPVLTAPAVLRDGGGASPLPRHPVAATLIAALPFLCCWLVGAWLCAACCPTIPAHARHEGRPGRAPPAARRIPAGDEGVAQSERTGEALRIELRPSRTELRSASRLQARRAAAALKPPRRSPARARAAACAGAKARAAAAAGNDGKLRCRPADRRLLLMQAAGAPTVPPTRRCNRRPGFSYCLRFIGRRPTRMRRGPHRLPHARQARFEGLSCVCATPTRRATRLHWYADSAVCQRGADNVGNAAAIHAAPSGRPPWQSSSQDK